MKLRRIAIETAAGLLGGALFAAALAGPCGPLCWLALVPWAILYGRPGSRTSIAAAAPGIVLYILMAWRSLLDYGVFFALIISLEALLYYGGVLALLRATSRWMPRVPIALRLPVLWTAMDYLFVRFEVFRGALFFLPNPLADWPVLIQIADIAGGLALAFPLAMVNGLAADLLLLLWGRRSPLPAAPSRRTIGATAGATIALLAGIVAYGLARVDRFEPPNGPRIALLQPDMPHIVGRPLGLYIDELYQTCQRVPAGAADLVIWPENSVLDFYDRPNFYLHDLTWMARSRQSHVLFGALGRAKEDSFRSTDSALLLSPEGRIEGHYEKIDLIPWAEYFPFESLLSRIVPWLNILHVKALVGLQGYFPTGTAGEKATLFPCAWQGRPLPFGVVICSEAGIPSRARSEAALGANFLVNLVSEGEAGGYLRRNMLRVCSLRAVENRRPFVRVGNTGITCTIDESGRPRDILSGERTGAEFNEPGILLARIPLPSSQRHAGYTDLGDLLPAVCALVAVLALARSILPHLGRIGAFPALLFCLALLAAAVTMPGCLGILRHGRGDFDSIFERGVTAFKEGRDNVALGALERATRLSPKRVEPYRYIAEILRRQKQSLHGYRFFEKRRDLARTEPEISAYLGYFQQELYQKSAAVESFRHALDEDPGQRLALLWLSVLLRDSNQPALLFPYLDRYLQLHPDDREVQGLLGEALLDQGRGDEAGTIFDAILEKSPEDPDALRLKGMLRLSLGRLEEAGMLMAGSARADPESVVTRYNQARIALMLGDMQGCLRAIEALHELEKKGNLHQ